ncbi:hypothetical protein BDE02_05G096200 [Populus trichocarpa]|nr:hypothetical protein BDE02_05G096200 [Populus trichocarpa]
MEDSFQSSRHNCSPYRLITLYHKKQKYHLQAIQYRKGFSIPAISPYCIRAEIIKSTVKFFSCSFAKESCTANMPLQLQVQNDNNNFHFHTTKFQVKKVTFN